MFHQICRRLSANVKTLQPVLKIRNFHSSTAVWEKYKVSFITPKNEIETVLAENGTNLLELAHKHNIDLEGACEGSLACSTCHVIVDKKFYDKLDEPSDEENDMLDLAFGLTET